MKKLFPFLFSFFAMPATAQTPFKVMDSINANNINALTLVHGDMWWDPATAKPHCEFPVGSKKHVGFAASLWLSAYDDAGHLHVAAQTYRQDGNDYWPGPLDGSGSLDYTTSEKWAKIWKVTRSEINTFRGIVFHTTTNTPDAILRWPGRNNAYAQGKDGAPLDINSDMAPFVDLNGDGKYQPLKGEYPDIKGEQALWWIFSDNGPTHTQTNGNPLKVEVHAMAYAYKRGTLIDNVVYYDYTIVNRSPENYHDFRLALWGKVGVWYLMDDFVGFDSTWRMGITYSATNNEGAGFPVDSFGHIPPMMAVTFVSLPGDAGTNYVSAGSFMYYNNDPSFQGKPVSATEYDNYMRAKWRMGVPLTNTFISRGLPSLGYGPGPVCNYVFPGDPADTGAWSECVCQNGPGDRIWVLSSNDFNILAGQRKRIVMALIVDSIAGGCPTVNFNGIKEVADTAWSYYHHPPPPIFTEEITKPNEQVSIYPNPAHNQLNIDCGNSREEVLVSICNVVGQQVGTIVCRPASMNIVDISGYAPGLYVVKSSGQAGSSVMMLVKE